MAGALILGAVLGDAVSKLSSAILEVTNKTRYFKSKLLEIETTIELMKPIFDDMEKLNKELDRKKNESDMFIKLVKQAEDLVKTCQHIKWNLWKRYRYASKLDDFSKSLQKFVNLHLPVQTARDVKETLKVAKDLEKRSSRRHWSCDVPLQKGVVIGFDDRVRDLKEMVLKDSPSPHDDCSIVVVSGAGGSGKTTLVTMLCGDPDIIAKFHGNIYYVIVSQSYDLKVIVTKLLGSLPNNTNNDEEAIQQWGSFLGKNESEILLVLDDVWSESVITEFKFKSPRYKILVTSRITFTQFRTYHLQGLNNQDATHLFRYSAFSDKSNIPEELVEKLVKCCKNHPLALSVVGGSLKGAHVANWEFRLKQLSEEKMSLLELHVSVQRCLEKCTYFFENEPEMKQCYLDLGLFPEDSKIAATTLMDMWAHLHNHDDGGLPTFNILTKLSSRSFATFLPKRKHVNVIANYCEEEFVVQHDMMRDLAIQLSSQEPIENRERLIINTDGKDLPQLSQIVNARIMSISTGLSDSFPATWNEINAPKVEVLVLNFMSNMPPLPQQFMKNMQKLKVLIITNYGYYFSQIQNFPAPECLSGLTRIRLDHVSISSISTTILMLENLQKLSLIMCKIGNSFSFNDEAIPNKLTRLLEIDIDSCDDLVTFPAMLCDVVSLKKLSINNCHELTSLSEDFGNLSNLEILRLASCINLPILPESMRNLKKLRIIDLFHCLSLRQLPLHIGELTSLETIVAFGCTSLQKLPKSIKDFDKLKVVCNEETRHHWNYFENVEEVEEDPLDTFVKIVSNR